MANFRVRVNLQKDKTTVRWVYNGSLNLSPIEFFVQPGFTNEYDAQSFALATLLPLAAVANESIELEPALPKQVADFWKVKINSLSPFYRSSMEYNLFPVEDSPVPEERGKDVAIMMGCGADSLSTLGVLLDQGIKPHLVLIEEREHTENYPGNLREKFVKKLAKDLDLKLSIVESNLWFTNRAALHKFLNKKECTEILNRSYKSFANDNLVRGFQMFFSSLAVLPTSVGKIIMSSSKEDRSEWFGCGFNYNNNVPYLGLTLETIPWEKKVDQYAYLLNKRPELLEYQKTCTHPEVQWCGRCWSCNLARCMQLAVGYPTPIEARPVKCFDGACIHMIKSARDYYKGTNKNVIKELQFRFSLRGGE